MMSPLSPRKMLSLTRRVLVARFMGTVSTAPHFRGFQRPCEFTDARSAEARDMAVRLAENARWVLTAAEFYERLADGDEPGARAVMVRFRESVPEMLVPETALLRVMSGDALAARLAVDCEDA
jgi:hypothetical protein